MNLTSNARRLLAMLIVWIACVLGYSLTRYEGFDIVAWLLLLSAVYQAIRIGIAMVAEYRRRQEE